MVTVVQQAWGLLVRGGWLMVPYSPGDLDSTLTELEEEIEELEETDLPDLEAMNPDDYADGGRINGESRHRDRLPPRPRQAELGPSRQTCSPPALPAPPVAAG